MIKYKTVALPVEVVERYKRITDVPLSQFVRATVNNFSRLVESGKPLDDVLSVFMFGGL